MNKKQNVVAAAVAATLGALHGARELRAAIEHRNAAYHAAPSGSPGDVLARLKANQAVRAAIRGASQ
ncbi:hypothetical protein [Caballeronia sp. RCC_10]|uniref:hypothetical protein n=1 Tax=Caballeronia sp. RCC_10 TaxID=3239227 RepID=UPI003524FE55